MTHSFLLKGEDPLACIPRDELVTIEHILLFCFDLTEAVFPSSVTEDVVRGRIGIVSLII